MRAQGIEHVCLQNSVSVSVCGKGCMHFLYISRRGIKPLCKSLSRLEAHIKQPWYDSFSLSISLPHFLISSFTISFLSNENSGTPKFKAGASNNGTGLYFSSVKMVSQIQFQIDGGFSNDAFLDLGDRDNSLYF